MTGLKITITLKNPLLRYRSLSDTWSPANVVRKVEFGLLEQRIDSTREGVSRCLLCLPHHRNLGIRAKLLVIAERLLHVFVDALEQGEARADLHCYVLG